MRRTERPSPRTGSPRNLVFGADLEGAAESVQEAGDRSRKPLYVGIGAVLLLLGFGAYAFQGARAGTADDEPGATFRSIAVLPFDNLSADPENAFFAAGIHEELETIDRVLTLEPDARLWRMTRAWIRYEAMGDVAGLQATADSLAAKGVPLASSEVALEHARRAEELLPLSLDAAQGGTIVEWVAHVHSTRRRGRRDRTTRAGGCRSGRRVQP